MTGLLGRYGLFVLFVGILAIAISVLGVFLLLGLSVAAGSNLANNLYMLRDPVLGLLLGVLALRSGSAMRNQSAKALRMWEICTWLIALVALLLTIASFLIVETGREYLVFTLFYSLLATSASAIRSRLS